MGEFTAEITDRIRGVAEALRQAEESGDDAGIQAHEAEMDDLRRIAAEHDVAVPEVAQETGSAEDGASDAGDAESGRPGH
jgi:hypothetical protein